MIDSKLFVGVSDTILHICAKEYLDTLSFTFFLWPLLYVP